MNDNDGRKRPKIRVRTTYRLTRVDAVEVWRLRDDGLYQHEIAQIFGVHQARVNDVLKSRLHPGSESDARA